MLQHVIYDVIMNDDNGIMIDEVSVSIWKGIRQAKKYGKHTTANDLLLMTICTNR